MRIDYDLHGIVGVRLVDPGRDDIAAASATLGPPTAALAREPDIVIRFVDRIVVPGPVRSAGSGAAFTDDAFLLLGSARRRRPVLRMPLARIGVAPCEIACERGVDRIPLFAESINLIALGKGWLPVHASAFVLDDVGALTAAWPGGGKTGTLLGFMASGARYVADDWVYVGGDGADMRGLPGLIEVKAEYVDQLPQLLDVPRPRRSALRLARRALRGLEAAPGDMGRSMARLRRALTRRDRSHVSPQALFRADARPLRGRLDVVLLAVTHDAAHIEVRPASGHDLARRLEFLLDHEWRRLLSCYGQFRFAFPDATNPLLEDRSERQRVALDRMLSGRRGFVVEHPSPAPIERLVAELSPCLRR